MVKTSDCFLYFTVFIILFLIIRDVFKQEKKEKFKKKSEEYYKKIHKLLLENLVILLEIFEEENIEYVANAGTLLGIVRNKGIIDKDDDIDITIMKDDYKRLKESIKNKNDLYDKFHDKGLHLYLTSGSFMTEDIVKVVKLNENGDYSRNNIFIDITETKEFNGKIIQGSWYHRWLWEDYWLYKEEFYPLKKGKLNGININIPNNPIPVLERFYGDCSEDKCWKIPLGEEGHHQYEINLD